MVGDYTWDLIFLKTTVEQSFSQIQRAWTERDIDIAKSYMSDGFYEKSKMQMERLIRAKKKNILVMPTLIEIKMVQVADFQDNKKDSFWACIKGIAIDYEINEASGEIIKGDKDRPLLFYELWKFIRTETGWVVDDISENFSKVKNFKSLIE